MVSAIEVEPEAGRAMSVKSVAGNMADKRRLAAAIAEELDEVPIPLCEVEVVDDNFDEPLGCEQAVKKAAPRIADASNLLLNVLMYSPLYVANYAPKQ
jgi:hypothetical protein